MPLGETVNWIKNQQATLGTKIQESQVNEYIYNQACEYLDLIG